MKKTTRNILTAVLCALPFGTSLAGDIAGGAGWSLSDEGVLTVGADYVWAEPVFYGNTKCQSSDAWSENAADVKSVVLADGVSTVGSCAFAQCKNIVNVSLPAGLKSIGTGAFAGCEGLSDIDIPSGVTEIGSYAFSDCKSFKGVALPKGFTTLGKRAFAGCLKLESVAIPEGVDAIEEYTFEGCRALKDVSLPKGLEFIGQYCFENCESLACIEIPAEVGFVDNGAFANCRALKRVTLKSTDPLTCLSDIFEEAVQIIVPAEALEAYRASGLAEYYDVITSLKAEGDGWDITVDGILSVTKGYEWKGATAGECAESWKDHSADILAVDVWEGVTSVAPGAFRGLTAADSVCLPASVSAIGAGAFAGCAALGSVTSLSATPPALGDDAFETGVGKLTVRHAAVSDYAASDWARYFAVVTSAVDGGEGWSLSVDGVVTVEADYAWPGDLGSNPWDEMSESLSGAAFSEGVQTVGAYAFSFCSDLVSITLPESLVSIGDCAFDGCMGLKSVTCLALTPPELGDYAFYDKCCPLFVPAEAMEAYVASDWARYFTEILALPATTPTSVAEADGGCNAVTIENGVVTVGGSPAAVVYTLSGLRMPAGRPLGKGLYVVATQRGAEKIAVR